jgi:Bacterial PH domain
MALAGHLWECIRMQGQGPPLPGAGAGQPAGGGAAPATTNGQAPWSPPGTAPPATAPQTAGRGVPQVTDQKMFRLPGAIVAWWAWVIFAVACLADVAATGRNHTAGEIAATLVFITGVVYACALRPRVLADSSAVTVMNPLRDHRIPWGSVAAVDLKESVRVHCVKEPGAKKGKIIHSWALYAPRRNRLRSELIRAGDRRRLPRSAFDTGDRSAGQKQDISKQPAAHIMAAQLDAMATSARDSGAAAGPSVVRWAWLPAAAILVPGILLVLVITVFT